MGIIGYVIAGAALCGVAYIIYIAIDRGSRPSRQAADIHLIRSERPDLRENENLATNSSTTTVSLSSSQIRECEELYTCPITKQLLKEPMICTFCRENFEKEFILRQVQQRGVCPGCKRRVRDENIVPNEKLKKAIHLFKKRLAKRARKILEQRIKEEGLGQVQQIVIE